MMLARIAIVSGFVVTICMADNFLIKDNRSADSFFNIKSDSSHYANKSGQDEDKTPQGPTRVVIEDVNPNSDLGQAIKYIIKDGKQKEIAEAKAKLVKKKIVKKKSKPKVKPKKTDDCIKPVPDEHVMEMSQMPSGETLKAKEAPVVDDKAMSTKEEGTEKPKSESPAHEEKVKDKKEHK